MGEKRKGFKAVAAVSLAVLLGGLGALPAYAHFLGYDSVDNGEIRYEDYTQWNDALNHNIAAWENLSGGVSIAPDSAFTNADLEVRDYRNDDGRCGYYTTRSGADLINLNLRFFDGYSTTNRRACMTHEWGHAHGLAHSYTSQVMDSCPVSTCNSTVPTTPQFHDREDYYYLW